MTTNHNDACMEKVKSLVVQGNTLALADAEATDFTWKSHIYDLRAGTLKFLVNAVIDTLPTAVNLKRWKKHHWTSANCARGGRLQHTV